MCAGCVARLAVAVFIDIAGGEGSAWFAFALSDSSRIAAAEPEIRHFDLRNGDADEVFSLLAEQFALRDVLLQVLFDLAPHDLTESEVILFDIENHCLIWALIERHYNFIPLR